MSYRLFVGIDWGFEFHHVCVLDAERAILDEKAFEHSGEGLQELERLLLKLSEGVPGEVCIGLETPRGAIVDSLLEGGFKLFALNPKQVDRFRDRYSMAGAKDDRRDSWVLAETVATDRKFFRELEADDSLVIELRHLVREEEELKRTSARTCNQVRDQLYRYYPALLRFCPGADELWMWDLLELAPTPARGNRLKRAQIGTVLKRRRIRRITPKEVLAALKEKPLQVANGVVEATSSRLLRQLVLLRLNSQQLKEVSQRTDEILSQLSKPETDGSQEGSREHRAAAILLSLPGFGRLTVATMLTEASRQVREGSYQEFRCLAGIAPVKKATGEKRRAGSRSRPQRKPVMRRACSRRLRHVLYHAGSAAARHDPAARAHYQALRSRGSSHARATRGVVDRLLKIAFAALASGTLYDPKRLKGYYAQQAA